MVDDDQRGEWARVASLHGVASSPPLPGEKLGVALNVRDGLWPVNGLRHPPAVDTCGWYVWAGEELRADDDFFQPVHLEHVEEWCPAALPFLGLPPGWRFLIAPGQQDVWFDPALLEP